MNNMPPQCKGRNRAITANVALLVILYVSTPDLGRLSPNGILDSLASAIIALALSHVALLVLPRRPATLLATLILLSSIVYNVANGFFFDHQQAYLSVNTLYLAAEITALLRALSVWQLTSGFCLILVAFMVLISLVSITRPGRIRTRFFSALTLCSLSVVMAVSYAAITDEAHIRVGDNSPLGHMLRSSGYVPFTTLDIELAAERERNFLVKKLRSDPEMELPPKLAAASIGSLMGYDETYAAAIGNERYPLFKNSNFRKTSESQKLTEATNVLLVVMESMRASEMGAYGAEQSATPFLDSLAKNNVIARKFYATSNYTVKSEHAINCSMLDFMIGAPVAKRGLPVRTQCLPERLYNEGYRTLWFHGNTKDFYSRAEYLPKVGFHEVYSRDELDTDGTMPSLGWGLTDSTVFDEALNKLESVDEPFYAEILTVSNHMPFDFDWDIEFPEYLQRNMEMLDRYRRGMYYTDQAFRKFHENFQKSSLAANTILVVTGDHGIWTFSSDELSGLEKNEQFFRVPLILQTPEGHNFEVDENTSHLDIAPTLSSLLGLAGPDAWMGRSLFDQDQALSNRVTYLMTEQALSYRFSDRACVPSVQCQNSVDCYRTHEQEVPETLCYLVEPNQDLLRDTQSTPIAIDPITAERDRALFEYSQIALESGTSPDFTGE